MQEIRQRLSTLAEIGNEDLEDEIGGGAPGQNSEQQEADQCAAQLLRTSSLIALGALDAGIGSR